MKRPRIIAWVVGGALAAALTYPTIFKVGSVARIDSSDGRLSVWNVAWVARSLVQDPAHLLDANIFHPHRGTLAYSEANLVAGAMAAPVYALAANPVAAHNVVVYVSFLLSFVAMWALVRRLTGDDVTALVPATAFAFAPFVAARTAHIQLLMVFVFPVALLAWHRFVDAPGVRRGVALGLALALAGLACGYYGIFAGLTIALATLWFAPRQARQRRYWLGILSALVVVAAGVGPVLRPYLALRAEAGARQTVNVEELRAYSADARAYLNSPAHAHQWIGRALGSGAAKEVLFPGLTATFLAIVGVGLAVFGRLGGRGDGVPGPRRTFWFYVALVALAAWASFGPDAGLYLWLVEAVPFMSFLRAPARAGVLVVFGCSAIAGYVLARIVPVKRRVPVSSILVVLVAAEVSAAPWTKLEPVPPVPGVYRMLATLPRGPVVEFHFPYHPTDLHNHTRYMFWSMWHWQPLVNGYSDYIPPDFRAITVPINAFPDRRSFEILRERGARYVVIHWDLYGPAGRAVLLARMPPYREYLRPLLQDGDIWLLEIVRYPE